jgi:hypothetical protein
MFVEGYWSISFFDVIVSTQNKKTKGFFMIRTALALLAILGTQSALAATVIHAGFLFDTREGEVLEKQSITVEDGRVVSVDDGFITLDG